MTAAGRPSKEAPLAAAGKTVSPASCSGCWNPSGLSAHYQVGDLARLFRALKHAVG